MPGLFGQSAKRQEEISGLRQRLALLENTVQSLERAVTEELVTSEEVRYEMEMTKADIVARVNSIITQCFSENTISLEGDFEESSQESGSDSDSTASESREVESKSTNPPKPEAWLESEVAALRQENQLLRKALQSNTSPMSAESAERSLLDRRLPSISPLSRQRIEEIVEKMLEDPSINCSYLPDVVERQIYRNVFRVLIGVIDKIVQESAIRFLGHEITMSLKPLGEEESATTQAGGLEATGKEYTGN